MCAGTVTRTLNRSFPLLILWTCSIIRTSLWHWHLFHIQPMHNNYRNLRLCTVCCSIFWNCVHEEQLMKLPLFRLSPVPLLSLLARWFVGFPNALLQPLLKELCWLGAKPQFWSPTLDEAALVRPSLREAHCWHVSPPIFRRLIFWMCSFFLTYP